MVRSMTGYGRAEATLHQRTITIELRSVNNRYFDCTVKMPKAYLFAEDALKTCAQAAIARGKVDVFVSVDQKGAEDVAVGLNLPVAEGYVKALRTLGETFRLTDDLSVAAMARFPDVFVVEKTPPNFEELTADLCAVLREALARHTEMRLREGARLAGDLRQRLDALANLTSRAEERSPQVVSEYRAKLEQRMRELLDRTDIDEARLLTEAAIFADKTAIHEEIVRLCSHMEQVAALLEASEPIGRKLDFLMQELAREANTIGSKGNDLELARIVVDMKAEIEKMREQVQNIE